MSSASLRPLTEVAFFFFTLAEVAQTLSLSERTIRRLIQDKKLVAHKFGGAVRIAEGDLKAFIAARRDD